MADFNIGYGGREITLEENEIIVSKTDIHGKILYVNDVFVKISGYSESELLKAPHSIIRHPAMPRCVFKFLWETIESGDEIFAYVINRCKNGDYYWVFAHVTPTLDSLGNIIGYHSSRRKADRKAIQRISTFYSNLESIERNSIDPKRSGVIESYQQLVNTLKDSNLSYGEFIFGL